MKVERPGIQKIKVYACGVFETKENEEIAEVEVEVVYIDTNSRVDAILVKELATKNAYVLYYNDAEEVYKLFESEPVTNPLTTLVNLAADDAIEEEDYEIWYGVLDSVCSENLSKGRLMTLLQNALEYIEETTGEDIMETDVAESLGITQEEYDALYRED